MASAIGFRAIALALLAAPGPVEAREIETQPNKASVSRRSLGAPPDSTIRYWLEARAQIDAAWYWGGENSFANGVQVRRARLGFGSEVGREWYGEFALDFAGDRTEIKDFW